MVSQLCQTLGDSRVWLHLSVVFGPMATWVYFTSDLALARLGLGGAAQSWWPLFFPLTSMI